MDFLKLRIFEKVITRIVSTESVENIFVKFFNWCFFFLNLNDSFQLQIKSEGFVKRLLWKFIEKFFWVMFEKDQRKILWKVFSYIFLNFKIVRWLFGFVFSCFRNLLWKWVLNLLNITLIFQALHHPTRNFTKWYFKFFWKFIITKAIRI